jgi:NAD(P)-dependent dehydrogenase (short-subunit alcohol dehydrogenase family)
LAVVDLEIHLPLGRFGEPAERATELIFLLGGAASCITGQTIIVEEGVTVA